MVSRLLSVVLMMFVASMVYCQQNPFMEDAEGHPLKWGSTYVIDGDPYFHKDYAFADLTSASGKTYKDVRIKFNLVERQLQYILDDGKEMVANTSIKKIRFPSLYTEDGVLTNVVLQSDTGFLNNPDANIYQVFDSGRVSLMKKINETFTDNQKYSEATTTRHFQRQEIDFIVDTNGEFRKLEKSKSFILELLKDKFKEVELYINKNNLKCKSFKDFRDIVQYYNSL
jgi:hypothetical protein